MGVLKEASPRRRLVSQGFEKANCGNSLGEIKSLLRSACAKALRLECA